MTIVHDGSVRHLLPTRAGLVPVSVVVVIIILSRLYPTLEVSLIAGR